MARFPYTASYTSDALTVPGAIPGDALFSARKSPCCGQFMAEAWLVGRTGSLLRSPRGAFLSAEKTHRFCVREVGSRWLSSISKAVIAPKIAAVNARKLGRLFMAPLHLART